ncbi:MAG: cobalt transporter CbiM [bacterium]
MHIPDNYLSPSTCAVLGAAMVPIWVVVFRKVKKEITLQKLPVLGIFSAFSFLIMMFNIPLPGGTTGHAIGATLIAVLMGPFVACITVTVALLIQALFFGDGGILAFSVNCFNMAFLMPFAGYYIYRLIKNVAGNNKAGNLVALFLASYVSLNIAAFAAAIQFGIQPILFRSQSGLPLYAPYPIGISIPAMMIPHLLVVGLVEALVSVGIYSYVSRINPEMIHGDKPSRLKPAYAMIVFMVILSPLGLLASGTAWGEWGNEELRKMLGYIPIGMGKGFSFGSLIPGYAIPSINNEVMAYAISAMLGVAIIFISFKAIALYIKK